MGAPSRPMTVRMTHSGMQVARRAHNNHDRWFVFSISLLTGFLGAPTRSSLLVRSLPCLAHLRRMVSLSSMRTTSKSPRSAFVRERANKELRKLGCRMRDMNPNANAAAAFVKSKPSFSVGALSESALSVPAVSCPPAELSDAELHAATRRLVGSSTRLLASLLAHLAEVEARGLHRTRACSSLYTYCVYELRFSEDEAFRRVSAARLVRRFPVLLDAIAAGELHLTGLLMLGPYLTADKLAEVPSRAKHRTKNETIGLVRMLVQVPDGPSGIYTTGTAA